jgi:DNA invertase Pin-like site-specific DNA recombinase
VQHDTIVRLAEQHDQTIGRIYEDWGRSGLVPDGVGDTLEDILAHRRQALTMMRAIQAGDVTAVFAYRQDRLARDSFTVHLMCRIAKRAGVPIVIPRGDITAREQALLTAVEGGMDQEEGSRGKDRGEHALKTMQDRGDDFGPVPLGWSKVVLIEPGLNSRGEPAKAGARVLVRTDPDKPARVVQLFRALGSYNATARRLNDDGVPPPNPKQRRNSAGPPMWSAATVRDIIQREAPDLAKQVSGRARTSRSFLFRGLLRCYCGAPMTASYHPRGTEYYCNRGKRGAHRPYGIAERKVRPWVEAEAARLKVWGELAEVEGDGYDDSADRVRLEAARDLVGEDAYAAALARLDQQRDEAGARVAAVASLPDAIDWQNDDIQAINEALLAIIDHVQLGDDLMPTEAVWRVPLWRKVDA